MLVSWLYPSCSFSSDTMLLISLGMHRILLPSAFSTFSCVRRQISLGNSVMSLSLTSRWMSDFSCPSSRLSDSSWLDPADNSRSTVMLAMPAGSSLRLLFEMLRTRTFGSDTIWSTLASMLSFRNSSSTDLVCANSAGSCVSLLRLRYSLESLVRVGRPLGTCVSRLPSKSSSVSLVRRGSRSSGTDRIWLYLSCRCVRFTSLLSPRGSSVSVLYCRSSTVTLVRLLISGMLVRWLCCRSITSRERMLLTSSNSAPRRLLRTLSTSRFFSLPTSFGREVNLL
mmetsp:Transcript_21491/g.54168  ORF Transcript_21491/g.54168 Transcript_21491/m.54168 type:complete len:282 (+) Transcript_21491:403-1248(+)